MKREELSIFYSLWLRCFVDMLQYVGFLGRSQLFGSQVKVGAPTWHLARANCKVGAPTQQLARQLLSWRAPSPGRSQRVRQLPRRFTPQLSKPKRPSRAMRAKRPRKRFGIPSPPASPVHTSSPTSSRASDATSLQHDIDLDLEFFTTEPTLRQLREHLHPLRQAGEHDPHFPVPTSDAVSQMRRLADLSHSAIQSGQVPLVHMASRFDFHSCSIPHQGASSRHDTSDGTSTDEDTCTTPGDAFQLFHTRACTPLHPVLHGFRNTIMTSPILKRLWAKYAHAHMWHMWDAVPAAGAANFIDACQNIRTQLTALQHTDATLWTPTKNWTTAWERFLTWDHIMGLPGTEHDCPSCTNGNRSCQLNETGALGATMWLVQDHHSVDDLCQLRSIDSDRWLIAIPRHRSDWKSELQSLCTREQAWLAVSGTWARPVHRWVHPHETSPYGRTKKHKQKHDILVDWYIVGTSWDIDIHRYIATLSQISGRGQHRATWYMPPRSLHTTAGKATEKHNFLAAWHSLLYVKSERPSTRPGSPHVT